MVGVTHPEWQRPISANGEFPSW